MKIVRWLLVGFVAGIAAAQAADTKIAAGAVNALGVDLYRASVHGEDNLLLSPYSIQNALAMTYAGADGETRSEMQRVLHFPADEDALDGSFGALARELNDAAAKSVEVVKQSKKQGGPSTPLEFHLANRLFAQRGYDFRASFLSLVKNRYNAPLEEIDYKQDPEKARAEINHWVENQTKDRIRDLIPAGVIKPLTRLTLVNALYLRAPWSKEFDANLTKPERFLVHGMDGVNVPTMLSQASFGYAKRDGYQVVTLAYDGGALQFAIVLPDKPDGLAAIEKQLTPKMIEEWAQLPAREIILHLPKFHQEPPTLPLGDTLKALGMKSAFDDPPHSANFDRMAPRKPADYLYIGAVLHKTFLSLDEKGTEAAAATAVVMMETMARLETKKPPAEVRVDHPFLFAIQHVPSGACLFLGRMTDPR